MRLSNPMQRWFLFLFFCTSLQAQLVWEQREFVFKATLHDRQVVAEFPFQNRGSKDVSILSITPSCAQCTFVDLAKRVYAPGERGVLRVLFVFGEMDGVQKKIIKVQTDQPGDEPVTLTISGTIPKILEVTPSTLSWEQDEIKESKAMRVKAAPEVTMLTAKSSSTLFRVEVKELKKEHAYDVWVTPQELNREGRAIIVFQTNFPKESPREVSRFVSIHPSPTIEQRIQAEPGIVFWKRNEKSVSKTIRLTVKGDKPIEIFGVRSSEKSIGASLKSVEKGRVYEVVVTPEDTGKPVKSVLQVDAGFSGKQGKLLVYAVVQ